MDLAISGLAVYTEKGVLSHATVTVQSGLIHLISEDAVASTENAHHFPSSYHLVPGFIDMHVHGANGADVMDATLMSLDALSTALAREGTTAFLATTMTADKDAIQKALVNVCNYINQDQKMGAEIVGAHLEGPFISPKKVGAQSGQHLLLPDMDLINQWQKRSNNAIKLVTLAPELENSDAFIRALREKNIVISIGHTDATYEETADAIHLGAHYATHLFNAMRGIHHREPGVVTAALLSKDVSTEIIVDRNHLHAAIVQLIYAMKGSEKTVLVTDSMRAKCLGDGQYDLGGQDVHVENHVARLPNGTLAGSTLTMSQAIKNMMTITDCTLRDCIKMTSENPAKMLNLFSKKGSIAPSKDADLVVLDDHLNVVLTVRGGHIVYQKQ